MKFVNNMLLEKYRFMALRKGIFLVFVLALSVVPVFQAAHALMHIAYVDMLGTTQAHDNQGKPKPMPTEFVVTVWR